MMKIYATPGLINALSNGANALQNIIHQTIEEIEDPHNNVEPGSHVHDVVMQQLAEYRENILVLNALVDQYKEQL